MCVYYLLIRSCGRLYVVSGSVPRVQLRLAKESCNHHLLVMTEEKRCSTRNGEVEVNVCNEAMLVVMVDQLR